jgi:DNA helicase II / ATP-dependent DNA helicase PcrA
MALNKDKLHKKFQEEYNRLNEQQRRAVDAIEGPVMVIAGPGTGKTQILASRIGKILLDTDVLPQNILCLTYTDAGVVAMRKRLQQFIGPDAYKVSLYTFHAFCNDVIQENLNLFEKTALDPISDLERTELFKELIDGFPKNHPLKRYRGDVYFEINNLQQLFSTMKREGWTPEFINQRIDVYISELPTRDEFIYKRKYRNFNAGDLKKDKIEDETERMEKLRAAVNEFARFQQLMRRRNRYDFDDMINWVLKAFEETPALLSRYQEQYLYILVDEYQDTSGTQNRLVEQLISYWNQPNIFVVGDDDQSIYRFQGANVENMLQFASRYQNDLFTVVLMHNYRSVQPILDIAQTLISGNEDRLINKIEGLSKNLTSANEALKNLQDLPVIQEYETMRQEMTGITLRLQQLVSKGVPPGRIAVIYKENRYGEELAQYCKQCEVPVYSKRNINLFELPEVKKILLLLRYLAAEHDISFGGDEMLFELLHCNWFHIPAIEIARLAAETADRNSSGKRTSMRSLLHEKATALAKDLFSVNIHPQLAKASAALEQLISDVPNTTLQHLFAALIRETGLLAHVMSSAGKIWQLRIVTAVFDFIKEETRRNPSLTLLQLVGMIDLMEREELPLPLVQVTGSEKGVNLLTAHGCKGLEFEYVFFAGCNAAWWEKKRKPGGGYKMPDTIFGSTAEAAGKGEAGAGGDMEELRRLFYVALTRAEQHLYISYSRFKNDGKEIEPSVFIAEIQERHQLPVDKVVIPDEENAVFTALQFNKAAAPEIEKVEEDFVNNILSRFVMNVTALNNYLKCPLGFYYRNLIRIPSPKNEATEFGSAVHHALEQLFRKMQDSKKDIFPGKDVFVQDFEWFMRRHRESFTKEQFDRRMEYGHEILASYYDEHIGSFSRIVTIERNIRNVVVNGVPLKGKLDKIEFDGKAANVVDYKTGDIEKAREKMKGPDDKQPQGGDYWRQAVFYKILVDNYEQKDWQVVSVEFDFIEPTKKKQYQREKLIITPADITTVSQQIKEVWAKIQNREFYTGCGKEDCHWCNFVKTNNLAVALHDPDDEEPDYWQPEAF